LSIYAVSIVLVLIRVLAIRTGANQSSKRGCEKLNASSCPVLRLPCYFGSSPRGFVDHRFIHRQSIERSLDELFLISL
jgi:hypothetical protein